MIDNKNDSALSPVPESERQHWMVPTTIFAGLAFSVPSLMVGATLVGSFGLSHVFWILLVSLVVFLWGGNALVGYLGAKTGRSASVIARTSFGASQSRFIVGLSLIVVNIGWFGINTAVAGNSLAVILGINSSEQWGLWAFLTILSGVLFALPAVIGYNSMKWTDYIAVPAGILLIGGAVVFALRDTGLDAMLSWNPEPSMTIFGAMNLILGANVIQWLISADYTRYSKPIVKDQILIPLGIIITTFVFYFTGAVMAAGIGTAEIVEIMQSLGFPFWGFLILYSALWTSQLVASYSIGLASANMFNINTSKGRATLTLIGSLLGVILAVMGILDHFVEFLSALAIVFPPFAAVMFVDFFFIRNQGWQDHDGWNWMATIAVLAGATIGFLTQYIVPLGIPAIQSLIITAIVYFIAMKIKAQVKPDIFTNPNVTDE